MTIAQVMATCDEEGIERPEQSYGGLESYRAPQEADLLDEVVTTLEAGQGAVAERKSPQNDLQNDPQDGFGPAPPKEKKEAESEPAKTEPPAEPPPGDGDPDEEPDDEPDEADVDTGAMTVEQEIVFYHKEGMTPSDIAEAMTTDDQKITPQKVGKVLARYKKEPQAFAMAGV